MTSGVNNFSDFPKNQGKKINCIWQKVGGSKAWRALDFKKWGLMPRSLTEVYDYDLIYQNAFFCFQYMSYVYFIL